MGLFKKIAKGAIKAPFKAGKAAAKGTYKATKWSVETAKDPDMPLYGEKRELYKKQKMKRDVNRRLDRHYGGKDSTSASSRGQRNVSGRSSSKNQKKKLPKLTPKDKARRKYG